MSSTWYPNGFQISVRWCSETRKLVKMRLKNITKKRHEKNTKICAKIVQKKGLQKVIVLWFFRVPSQHGLYGVPGAALGPKSTSKRRPGHGSVVTLGPYFHFLWTQFGIFPVFHEQQIGSTRCWVYGRLCLGSGGKPTVDASQMPPRCLSPQWFLL